MQFMDTHIHLQDYNANNTTEIIRAAEMAGVNRFICVSATEDEWPGVLELAAAYPGIIVPALGLHPWYLEQTEDGWEKRLEESLKQNPQALVGECGFDRLKNPDFGRQKLFLSCSFLWRENIGAACLSMPSKRRNGWKGFGEFCRNAAFFMLSAAGRKC